MEKRFFLLPIFSFFVATLVFSASVLLPPGKPAGVYVNFQKKQIDPVIGNGCLICMGKATVRASNSGTPAKYFEVEISRFGEVEKSGRANKASNGEFVFNFGEIEPDQYEIRVRAVDAAGQTSDWLDSSFKFPTGCCIK